VPPALLKDGVELDSWDISPFKTLSQSRHFLRRILSYHKPKEVARDGEMTFRSKEHGIEKKRENLIPPIKFPIMGIFHPFFYLILEY